MTNEIITNIIRRYNANPDDNSFASKVVRILVIIYGQEILNNPESIGQTIVKYGLPSNQVLLFGDELNNYLESRNASSFLTVYKILIDMIAYKHQNTYITNSEVNKYESIFFEGRSVAYLKQYWDKTLYNINHKAEFKDDIHNPYDNYLQGKNISEIKALENDKLTKEKEEKLKKYNEKIEQDFTDETNGGLSSGNGFVDVMMILSFVATQVMIGFISLAHFIRR